MKLGALHGALLVGVRIQHVVRWAVREVIEYVRQRLQYMFAFCMYLGTPLEVG